MKEEIIQLRQQKRELLDEYDKRERKIRFSIIFISCPSLLFFSIQNIFLDSLGILSRMGVENQEGLLKFSLMYVFILLLPVTCLFGGFLFWYLGPMEKVYKLKYEGGAIDGELRVRSEKRFNRFVYIHNFSLAFLFLVQTLPAMRFSGKNGIGVFLDLMPKIILTLELMIFSWTMIEYFALRPYRLTMDIYSFDRKAPLFHKTGTQFVGIPLLFIFNSQLIIIDAIVKMFMGTVSRSQIQQEKLGAILGGGVAAAGTNLPVALSGDFMGYLPEILNSLIGLLVVSLIPAIAVFLGLWLLQRDKLDDLKGKLDELSRGSGDLTKKIRLQSEDELASITSLLNDFIENLRQKLLILSRSAAQVMQSNEAMNAHLENTSAATEEMVASVNQINRTTVSRTETISRTGKELLSLVESLDRVSASVENQAAFVDQSSSAVNEMAASISSVSQSTRKASELSSHLKDAAKEGERAVIDSIGAVKAVETSSEEVNSLVTLITDTADTTNLLAMNAAIEAAHAGEAGKGFAVVADEVRRLAEDSSEGARQITGQIQTMVDVVGKGVQLSEGAGASLGRVLQDVEETSRVIEGIALAMDEQNSGAGEILKSISSLVDATTTIKEVTAEQKRKNESMRQSVDMIVQAFNEIKIATDEQAKGTQEIVELITALQDVAGENQEIVETLEKAFSGFTLN